MTNDPFSWLEANLRQRRRLGLLRKRRRPAAARGARLVVGGRTLVNFSSNDYLDLATDPRLAAAATRAARRSGTGAGASPLVSGLLHPLRALERDLARWEGTSAALVFSSGYAANLGVVSALAGNQDAIFSDAWNHASLIDGCRLSRARVHVYDHTDLNHLADLLRTEGAEARRRFLVTDSVFSMDGDLAPLAGLLDLAERYDALVILDEAHATGVLGDGGRGLTDLLPTETKGRERVVKVGTLSKALGAQGGFVCGPHNLVTYCVNVARPYIYSTALAPPSAAAARQALRLVEEEPWRRTAVLRLAEAVRARLGALGYDVGSSLCQIVPVLIGDPHRAVALSQRLEQRGLLVPAIRAPSVPPGTCRLRISLSAGHRQEDIDQLIDGLRAG